MVINDILLKIKYQAVLLFNLSLLYGYVSVSENLDIRVESGSFGYSYTVFN
jgi:hypothetical protein